MKKLAVASLIVLLSMNAFAQVAYLSVAKIDSKKEKKIQKGKRIKVLIEDNNIYKYKGKLHILDSNTIVVKSDTCSVANILTIQRKSLLAKVFGSMFIGLAGYADYSGVQFLMQSNSFGLFIYCCVGNHTYINRIVVF